MPFGSRKTPQPLDEPALYEYAIGVLARQMRSVTELKRLMSRKVEPGEPGVSKMTAVVARLIDQKYLDDGAFATNYTRLRQENQSFGKRRVQRELTRKGVSADLAASTIADAYAQTNEDDLVRQYVARKRIAQPVDQKQATRLTRRLAGAGFSFKVISSLLKKWEIDLELPEDESTESS